MHECSHCTFLLCRPFPLIYSHDLEASRRFNNYITSAGELCCVKMNEMTLFCSGKSRVRSLFLQTQSRRFNVCFNVFICMQSIYIYICLVNVINVKYCVIVCQSCAFSLFFLSKYKNTFDIYSKCFFIEYLAKFRDVTLHTAAINAHSIT